MRPGKRNGKLKVIRSKLGAQRRLKEAEAAKPKKPLPPARVVSIPSAIAKESLFGPGKTFDPADPTGNIFRRIGQGRGMRTLPSFLGDEMHRQADRYTRENPFIRRLVKLTGDFIVGDGLELSSEVEQIAEVLDQYWTDPINNWEENQHCVAEQFRGRGEVIFEKALNIIEGYIRLSPIDPLHLSRVTGHPAYFAIPNKLWFRTGSGEVPAQILNTVPEDLRDPTPGLAEVYYFRANQQGLRGYSDFYAIFEWADSLDNASFSLLERMINLQLIIWHYKSASFGDQERMNQTEEQLTQMRGNSILMTDLEEQLEAIVPQLGAAEFTQGFDKIRQIIAMGGDVPVNWLSTEGGANVGEANAMDAVTFRAMRRKQREYLTLHRHIANDVIAEAVKRGKIPKMVFLPGEKKLVKPQDAYTIKVDPVSKREMSAIVTQLVGLASSMPLFEDLQYIQKSEAREVVRHVIGEIVELRDSTVNDDKLGPEVRKVFTPERMQQLRKIDEALREAA